MTGYMYYDPPFVPMALFLAFTMTNLFAIAWIFLNDYCHVWIANIALAMAAFFAIIGMVVALRALRRHSLLLKRIDRRSDIYWTITLVHNGFGLYTAWLCVATLINFCTVLTFDAKVAMDTSTYICLGILCFDIILFFIADAFIFWKATKYLFTPYLVPIFSLIGVILDNWDRHRNTAIFMTVIVSVTAIFLLIKIILSFWRSDKDEYYDEGMVGTRTVVAVQQQPQLVQQRPQILQAIPAPTLQPVQAVQPVRAVRTVQPIQCQAVSPASQVMLVKQAAPQAVQPVILASGKPQAKVFLHQS